MGFSQAFANVGHEQGGQQQHVACSLQRADFSKATVAINEQHVRVFSRRNVKDVLQLLLGIRRCHKHLTTAPRQCGYGG